MDLNLFLPAQASPSNPVPILYYLSGLTCTPNNCSEKGFFQSHAARHGIAIVWPDTSPRGAQVPGEDGSWDFGSGAGFYLNATKEPWKQHYNMYTYLTEELPGLLHREFPQLDGSRVSITGHSMGGHGALMLALKNPEKFKSVSAFSAICNPVNCAWGKKAFSGYFGEGDTERWKEHDASELLRKAGRGCGFKALIDIGTGDNFYKQGQLLPENLEKVAKEVGAEVDVRYRKDYDHSYYFVSTFAGEHVDYHAKFLCK